MLQPVPGTQQCHIAYLAEPGRVLTHAIDTQYHEVCPKSSIYAKDGFWSIRSRIPCTLNAPRTCAERVLFRDYSECQALDAPFVLNSAYFTTLTRRN